MENAQQRLSRTRRFLRAAFSVVFGLFCLLLVVLWIRTHFVVDHIDGQLTAVKGLGITSRNGGVGVVIAKGNLAPWDVRSFPAGEQIQIEYKRALGFIQYQTAANQFRLRLPYSALVLLCAACAALPWIHWSKQFSLRTVLIVTTFLGLALGLVLATSR
jgi:hypothetical protein